VRVGDKQSSYTESYVADDGSLQDTDRAKRRIESRILSFVHGNEPSGFTEAGSFLINRVFITFCSLETAFNTEISVWCVRSRRMESLVAVAASGNLGASSWSILQ
jgi:hypothetical protein